MKLYLSSIFLTATRCRVVCCFLCQFGGDFGGVDGDLQPARCSVLQTKPKVKDADGVMAGLRRIQASKSTELGYIELSYYCVCSHLPQDS